MPNSSSVPVVASRRCSSSGRVASGAGAVMGSPPSSPPGRKGGPSIVPRALTPGRVRTDLLGVRPALFVELMVLEPLNSTKTASALWVGSDGLDVHAGDEALAEGVGVDDLAGRGLRLGGANGADRLLHEHQDAAVVIHGHGHRVDLGVEVLP